MFKYTKFTTFSRKRPKHQSFRDYYRSSCKVWCMFSQRLVMSENVLSKSQLDFCVDKAKFVALLKGILKRTSTLAVLEKQEAIKNLSSVAFRTLALSNLEDAQVCHLLLLSSNYSYPSLEGNENTQPCYLRLLAAFLLLFFDRLFNLYRLYFSSL